MSLQAPVSRGMRVGLRTDVKTKHSFSVRQVMASAHDAALATGTRVDAQALLWYATRGGAQALGLGTVGCLAPGHEADVIALDVPEQARGGAQGAADHARLFDAIAFRRDAGPARAVLVRGRTLR